MFERFSDRARRVIVLSQEEVKRLKGDAVGTEHILLGILREGTGNATKVLSSLNVSTDLLRGKIEGAAAHGQRTRPREVPFTPRAKKALEMALSDARRLGHNYVGTEHLLLGVIHEEEGIGARVLFDLGLDLELLMSQVVSVLQEEEPVERRSITVSMPARISLGEAQRFLTAEARLLDDRRFDEWEALFTNDGTYWLPIDPHREASGSISIIYDDRQRLHERVYRLTQTPVLDQNPPSKTVHFVSNVEVEPAAGSGDSTVRCNHLIAEMRPGGPGQAGLNAPRWFAARCEYRLRQIDGAWKIAQKKVVFLNSNEPHYNLSFIP